jgi:hypothetical protein
VKIIKNKNPITGATSMYALTESTKEIYNPFVAGDFEKVSLVVECPALDQPYVMLWTKGILTPDAADVYQGSIRIDDQVVPVAWRIGGSSKDFMTAIPNGVVQKLQTGKSVIVSFRSLKAGEQFPVFNLTGVKTTMDKLECPNLTR